MSIVLRTEDLDAGSVRVAQQALAIDKEINRGKQFPVSIDYGRSGWGKIVAQQ